MILACEEYALHEVGKGWGYRVRNREVSKEPEREDRSGTFVVSASSLAPALAVGACTISIRKKEEIN